MAAATSPQPPLTEQKRALRAQMRLRREGLDPAERARASRALAERLAGLPELAGARRLAAFVSTRGEVDLSLVSADRAAAGVGIALPRVEGSASAPPPRLRFHLVTGDTALAPGRYGILEPPAASPEVSPAGLDVLLVPGLAFDDRGHRLGYGGGYYDEVLAALPARVKAGRAGPGRPFVVGVGFDFQLIHHCPAGEGDVTIDCVVTDARVVRCTKVSRT